MHRWLWVPREGGASSLSLDPGESPQSGWRWCRRCNGFWHQPSGPGACVTGQGHTDEGSGLYALVQGPLVPRSLSSIIRAWDVEGTPFVLADSNGALKTFSPSTMPRMFFLDPSGDGRVLLRWSANNLYVVVDAATQRPMARAGRDQATRFSVERRDGRRFHLRSDGGQVTVSTQVGDAVTVSAASASSRSPQMVVAFDAHALDIPSLI